MRLGPVSDPRTATRRAKSARSHGLPDQGSRWWPSTGNACTPGRDGATGVHIAGGFRSAGRGAITLPCMAPASTAFPPATPGCSCGRLLVFWPAASTGASAAAPAAALGFVLPVAPPPVVLTPFRAPDTRYGPGHRGVDLAAAAGSTVLAAGPGRVVFAGTLAGRGVLSIEHEGGMRTTYEPVAATVRAGRAVTAGEVIGTLQPGHRGCAPATLSALGCPPARPALPRSDVAPRAVAGPVAAVGWTLTARRMRGRDTTGGTERQRSVTIRNIVDKYLRKICLTAILLGHRCATVPTGGQR